MKSGQRILLMIIALIILIGCSKQIPTMDDMLLQKFQVFKVAVEKVATDLDVELTEIGMKSKMHIFNNVQVGGYTEEDEFGKEVSRGIHIAKSFLVNPDVILQHVATHEVCHFHLFDQGKANTEMAAEGCVWAYRGEELFMEAYRLLYTQEGMEMPSLAQIKVTLGVQ